MKMSIIRAAGLGGPMVASRPRRGAGRGRLALLVPLVGWMAAVPAATAVFTSIESHQVDQVTDSPPFEFPETLAGDSQSDPEVALVQETLTSNFSQHQFTAWTRSSPTPSGANVVLQGLHHHELTMSGVQGTQLKWHSSDTLSYGNASYQDLLTFAPASPLSPKLTTLEFVWNVYGDYTRILDIRPDEQPLYRLETSVAFATDANGAEVSPVNIEVTVYDPDTSNPAFTWSLMDDDVNQIGQMFPFPDGAQQTLTVDLVRQESGVYDPVTVDASLTLESRDKFLNDGAGINYYLDGRTELRFGNSAELIGLRFFDETRAQRTDVIVNSASGYTYTLIPEPATMTLLALSGLATLRRRRY